MGFKGKQFMSVQTYRDLFKPADRKAAEWAHSKGLKVYYHSCGNVNPFVPELIDVGVDMLNPLEVKAGMDVVELRRRYGHRIGFCGNLDVQKWERGDRDEIRAEILRKLNAARGGGLILQSDHSVTSGVSGRTYDYIVKLIREVGTYPLDLDEFEERGNATA